MKIEFDYFSEMAKSSGIEVKGTRFIRGSDETATAFDMWDGYFDPILEALYDVYFKRKAIPYLPLLHEWNELKGYEETGCGPVLELAATVDALCKINRVDLAEYPSAPGEVGEVLRDLISFLQSAISQGQTVMISKGL
jgi:hypothetical protein